MAFELVQLRRENRRVRWEKVRAEKGMRRLAAVVRAQRQQLGALNNAHAKLMKRFMQIAVLEKKEGS